MSTVKDHGFRQGSVLQVRMPGGLVPGSFRILTITANWSGRSGKYKGVVTTICTKTGTEIAIPMQVMVDAVKAGNLITVS